MSWDAARAALDTQMATLAGATIAWPGRVFTPPAASTWHKVSFIPATVESALTASGDKHEKGIYQVSVFAPPGSGIGGITRAVDAVVALFDRKTLGPVGCGVPVPGPLIEEADWLHQPVSIPFVVL